ncbi:MAG: hypothetical protein Q9174_001423, partial [Haloplaca sp. 1 TL-2023]
MKDKLPATYLFALDTTTGLEPDNLRKTVQELSLFYSYRFKITIPPLNYPLLLFKHVRDLALPIEVYPVVCRIAKLLEIDFSFPEPRSRHKVSSMPEIALVSLLIISVKLYYPFDKIEIHPRSLSDACTLNLDWDCWCDAQKKHDAIETANGKLGRGNEIKVTEEDVLNLSGEQTDDYLDWFEKTWVDEERARKHPRGHPEQLLDMFPTGRPAADSHVPPNPAQDNQDEEAALEAKLEKIQESLRPRN